MFKNSISIKVEVKEARIYTDVDDINRNQTYEHIGGFFPVWAELVEENNIPKDIIKGLNSDKHSKIIATKHEHEFKRGDLVRLYETDQYKITSVKQIIDPQYINVVRLFPHAKRLYTWKVITLGE